MTEPENFDDELFADLYVIHVRITLLQRWILTVDSYNDDEPSAKPTQPPEADQYSAVQAAASETKDEYSGDTGQQQDYNGGGDAAHANEEDEEEEDDDDIDFNLGNGPSTAVTHHDRDDQEDEKPAYSAPPAPPPPTKGPNAKEDG
jgi:hypothetical protein